MSSPSNLTLVSAAVVAYAISNVTHEGLGHALACEAMGGRLVSLNAAYVECDGSTMTAAALRMKSAAGSIANLALAALAAIGLQIRAGRPRTLIDLVLWLLLALNLMQPAGYLLFSGVTGVGDWARVVGDHATARIALAVCGAVAYGGAVAVSLRWVARFAGGHPDRQRLAVRLTVVPYVAGGLLYAAAGLLNPIGIEIMLISSVAAGFGGTSGLAWMAQLLHDEKRWPAVPEPLSVPDRRGWWGFAAVTATAYIAILGPTVTFGS